MRLLGLKAHWFRHSAFVRRWREAVNTRREEMYRTLQSFAANRRLWLERAELREAAGQDGAAAFARRYDLGLCVVRVYKTDNKISGKHIVMNG